MLQMPSRQSVLDWYATKQEHKAINTTNDKQMYIHMDKCNGVLVDNDVLERWYSSWG